MMDEVRCVAVKTKTEATTYIKELVSNANIFHTKNNNARESRLIRFTLNQNNFDISHHSPVTIKI